MPTVEQMDPQQVLRCTAKASQHFINKLRKAEKSVLRLWLRESGCTGYMYELALEDAAQDGDLCLTLAPGATLALDPAAVPLVQGTEIDLVTDGVNQVVKFNNPNVVSACGCGESFSVNTP